MPITLTPGARNADETIHPDAYMHAIPRIHTVITEYTVSSTTENIQLINETAAYTSTTIPSMEAMNSPTVETAITPDIAGIPSLIILIIIKSTSNITIYTMPTPVVLAIPVSNADIPAPLRLFASDLFSPFILPAHVIPLSKSSITIAVHT